MTSAGVMHPVILDREDHPPVTSVGSPQCRQGRRELRLFALLALVVVTLSASIVYTDVQTYDPQLTTRTGYVDSQDYVQMYDGHAGTGIRAYRPLVPFVAHLVPAIPSSLFSTGHRDDRSVRIAIKFGIVNFVFLVGAALAFSLLMGAMHMPYLQRILGVVLFLSMQTVVRSAGLPMTDTAFYFFFVICLLAILRDRFWLLVLAAAVGVLAKELVLLSAPLILLSLHSWRTKMRLLLATIPACGAYALVRLLAAPSARDEYITGGVLRFAGDQIRSLLSANGSINLFLAFGLLWLFAIYGLTAASPPSILRRWAWLVPLVLLGVLLGSGNLGRSSFTAFPVVIPLAVIGLAKWVGPQLSNGAAPNDLLRLEDASISGAG